MSRPLSPYLYLFITVALITTSEIFLKVGAVETAPEHVDWLGLSSLSSRRVWLGAALLVLSSITWILVVRAMPLYRAFNLCNVIHITIPISSWLILGDKISAIRWAGIALVLSGVWLIARPAAQLEERS